MIPIVTPAEMAAIDAAAPEPVEELVERAGWAVAREALDLLGGSYGRRVVIVAGKGNNGADGRVAARLLERRGVRCTVVDAADPPGPVLPAADLVVDAAYGTGFRGTYDHPRPARSGTPVLAVDIPSGIDGLTGIASGTPCRAIRTVTFAALKPGLLLGDGPSHTGRVVVADIGLDTGGARAHHVDVEDLGVLAGAVMARRRDVHKWSHAARIIAGSPGMTGAATLTASAALRSGAGYVRLSSPGTSPEPTGPDERAGRAPEAGTHGPAAGPTEPLEAVVTPLPHRGWAAEVLADLDRFAALGVGPGLGRSEVTDAEVRELVSTSDLPVLVDGDGLRALGTASGAGRLVASRPSGAGPVVLTPHDGEYEALTGTPPTADRLHAVRALSEQTGATVLLKGPTTLVAAPDGRIHAVTAGDDRLATAGTGDVLSGIVTGLLASGLGGPEAAAAAGVIHGRAGALASPRGLVAGDLLDHLPTALTEAFGE